MQSARVELASQNNSNYALEGFQLPLRSGMAGETPHKDACCR